MASAIEKDENPALESRSQQLRAGDNNTTTILDLNDDCLREICESLVLLDLCVFADVCIRFKQIAQAHFITKKLGDVTREDWCSLRNHARFSLLRNFGSSISSLTAVSSYRIDELFVEMMVRFCAGTLNALTLLYFRVDANTVMKLTPLLVRLQKFGTIRCTFGASVFDMLPSCLPDLRELELGNCNWLVGSRGPFRTFPKLEMLSIGGINDGCFEEFLKENQQLKSIELKYGYACYDLFDLLAKCIPSIESLSIPNTFSMTPSVAVLRNFNALKKLVIKGSTGIAEVFSRMAAAQVPIEYLELNDCKSSTNLMTTISTLSQIRTLRFVDVLNIDQSSFINMCNNLDNLTELYLRSKSKLNADIILNIVQKAKNLQKLHAFIPVNFPEKLIVDVDLHMKILNIVECRNEKKQLEITLLEKFCSIEVPKDLRNANKHLLTIGIEKNPKEIDYFTDFDGSEFDSNDMDYYDYDDDPYRCNSRDVDFCECFGDSD